MSVVADKDLLSTAKELLEEAKKGGQRGRSALERLEGVLKGLERGEAGVRYPGSAEGVIPGPVIGNSPEEARDMLTSIIEASSDLIGTADPQGRLLYLNKAGRKMLGVGEDEDVCCIRIPDTHTLWAGELVLREGLPMAAEKGAWAGETAFISREGRVIPASQLIMAHKGPDGNVLFYSTIARDITERKRAEAEVRQSEERFRQIFEQSDSARLILRFGDFSVIDLNPAAVSLFGYSREELAGTGPAAVFGGAMEEVNAQLISNGSFRTGNIESRKKDGGRIIISLKGQLVRLKESDVVYCYIGDMTERTVMEEEARAMQAKLIHANKMTSIGTLASGVAHEINNPNNFILFNSTLLADTWTDAVKVLEDYYREHGDYSIGGLPFSEMKEVIPELLTGISEGARRIKGIVESLKDFSRTDRSGMDGEVNVNDAVNAAASILGNQILKHTDNFSLRCADGLPAVKGSIQKIEQVVINLIMNALHALTDRGRGVRVETSREEASGEVLVRVTDEGAGMTKEVLDRIMEPFFTTKSAAGGTGLGLSISYSIIKEHGGSLEFDSLPGRGTTATLRFPADERAKTH